MQGPLDFYFLLEFLYFSKLDGVGGFCEFLWRDGLNSKSCTCCYSLEVEQFYAPKPIWFSFDAGILLFYTGAEY